MISGGAEQNGCISQRLLDPTHRVPDRMRRIALARAGLDDFATNMRANNCVRVTINATDEKQVPAFDAGEISRDTCCAIRRKRHEVILLLTPTHRRRQPQLGPHMHRVHLLNRDEQSECRCGVMSN